jgi:hypothetical protein
MHQAMVSPLNQTLNPKSARPMTLQMAAKPILARNETGTSRSLVTSAKEEKYVATALHHVIVAET